MKDINMLMFTSPLSMWDAWFMVLGYLAITASAGEALNHQPRKGNWVEKTMLYMVMFGAGGCTFGPFFSENLFPNVWEMTLTSGSAVFAVWLTMPYWRQDIALLDRRKRDEAAYMVAEKRRGLPTDEDEGTLCSH